MASPEEREIVAKLNGAWTWTADWVDSSEVNTAGRLVVFSRKFKLESPPSRALIHFSADTRYKCFVNGARVAVGPARSSPLIWYYDSLDISRYLHVGDNVVTFVVMRYFAANRAAMPFERTSFPGLTVYGSVLSDGSPVDLTTLSSDWDASVDESVHFPTGLIDDGFLHISERIDARHSLQSVELKPYNFKTLNGDLLPWRLRARGFPMPEYSHVSIKRLYNRSSSISETDWLALFAGDESIFLPANSSHNLDLQAAEHSTAFLRWTFRALQKTLVKIHITYSEGYELQPRSYPFFRTKADRLDAANGSIVGPSDCVSLEIPEHGNLVYEPFWFRTFRIARLLIDVGQSPVEWINFEATQANYPLNVKATWRDDSDAQTMHIWDVSIRTLRNCMFDGYSDCPFYEQLQYSMDSRAVGLFHYLLSGDDRLMRDSLTNFAASVTQEGLTQSRFPSHVNQLIAAFPLYWILQICDHHLIFGDTAWTRRFLPRIDGILEFFEQYIDDRGLISELPDDVWQFVDWVTTWHATDEHPDKGVPTSGRRSNLHTYFSLLLAYVLKQAAQLVCDVGRPGYADEYLSRATLLCQAARRHCYNGAHFTDSTADIADETSFSQHCQVFAVLCGAASSQDSVRLLASAFAEDSSFSKCSYMMQFYAFRAFAIAGDEFYESRWPNAWLPWRNMLENNLSTWEEDDVRQRSDCHAWGSIPIYEFCVELAGIHVLRAGCTKLLFKPRVRLSTGLEASVALGRDNLAKVMWKQSDLDGSVKIQLKLLKPVEVASQLPDDGIVEHGVTDEVNLYMTSPMVH